MTRAITVDAARLQAWIDTLAGFSDAPAPAVTRVLFSDADLAARAWVKARCEEEGLVVREDAVGNTFARWRGADDDVPAVATGSHIDAIPSAGKYDGVVGVLGAIEAFSALRRAGVRPARSLELLLFTAEEPTRFGLGCLGSRLLSGAISAAQAAALVDADGRSLDDWRAHAGFGAAARDDDPRDRRDRDGHDDELAPQRAGEPRKVSEPNNAERSLASVRLPDGHYAAFIELHIEQGPLLEREGLPIGIVQAIAGPSSYRLRLTGQGGHAGAVLMPDRQDAGLAGAEIALAVERAARESGSPDTVGTTGVFQQWPNAINSIPAEALLEIDMRDTRLDTRVQAWTQVEAAIAEICRRRGVRWTLETINENPPAACAPALVELLESVCADLALPARRMVSRAYHDSLFMARVCPTTMIFIPCRGGVSHRPDEYASPEAIAQGVTVLAHALARAADAPA